MRLILLLSTVLFSLFVTNAQNIGVGTNNPGSKLSVNGNLSVGSNYSLQNAPVNSLIIESRLGIGNNNPLLSLDINGGLRYREENKPAANAVVVSSDKSLFRLTNVAGVQANAISMTGATEGQFLTVVNEDDNSATFEGNTVGANGGTRTFVYSNGVWRLVAGVIPETTGWALTGNTGTNPTNNFIGTTDSVNFIVKTNNNSRLTITADGKVGIKKTPVLDFDVEGSIMAKGYYFGNSQNPLNIELTRDLPAVGQARTLGTFNLANNGHAIRISVVLSNANFSSSKYYLISLSNNMTQNEWYSITPVSASKVGGNDFELDLLNNGGDTQLRLRRTKGTDSATNVKIRVEYTGSSNATFVASNNLMNPATVSGYINNNGNGNGIDAGEFLIEANTRTANNYFDALVTCGSLKGHLCRIDELFHVCENGIAGVTFTNGVQEWVAGATSGGGKAPTMMKASGNCRNFDEVSNPGNNANAKVFRCCFYK
jgi:hypothetical protein